MPQNPESASMFEEGVTPHYRCIGCICVYLLPQNTQIPRSEPSPNLSTIRMHTCITGSSFWRALAPQISV